MLLLQSPEIVGGDGNEPVSVKSSSSTSGPAWEDWKCSSSTSVRVTILAGKEDGYR